MFEHCKVEDQRLRPEEYVHIIKVCICTVSCLCYVYFSVIVVVVVCKQLMFILMCLTGCHCDGKECLYYEAVSI